MIDYRLNHDILIYDRALYSMGGLIAKYVLFKITAHQNLLNGGDGNTLDIRYHSTNKQHIPYPYIITLQQRRWLLFYIPSTNH